MIKFAWLKYDDLFKFTQTAMDMVGSYGHGVQLLQWLSLMDMASSYGTFQQLWIVQTGMDMVSSYGVRNGSWCNFPQS